MRLDAKIASIALLLASANCAYAGDWDLLETRPIKQPPQMVMPAPLPAPLAGGFYSAEELCDMLNEKADPQYKCRIVPPDDLKPDYR